MTVAKQNILEIQNLEAYYKDLLTVKNVSFVVQPNTVVALIGPSGCGKSTLLRCLNRMHEETDGAKVNGKVLLAGQDIYAYQTDPVEVRTQIGMVFQKPAPFPSMSIYENVVAGLLIRGVKKRSFLDEVVEKTLKQVALWPEVKDKLKASGMSLSGGQQQRLCIARALAVKPSVILMDEPTSALDPISTAKIEEQIVELKKEVTIVIVTHNLQQAARISNRVGFMYLGEMVEFGDSSQMFTMPKDTRTENYITGRFG